MNLYYFTANKMAEFVPANTSTSEIESLVERHRHSKLSEIAVDYNSTLHQDNLNLRITPAKFTSLQLIFVLITRGIYDIPEELTADLIPHPETIIGALSSSAHAIGQGGSYSTEDNYDVIPGIYWLYVKRDRLRPYLLATIGEKILNPNTYDILEPLVEWWQETGNEIDLTIPRKCRFSIIISRLNPDGLFLLAASLHEQPHPIFDGYAGIDNFIEIVKE